MRKAFVFLAATFLLGAIASAPAFAASTPGSTISMVATAYGPTAQDNYPYGATDYFGQPLTQGDIAVDPNVIPLKTCLYVTGYQSPYLPTGGEIGEADDEGGAIKGHRVDLYYRGTESQINRFGIQRVTVTILGKPTNPSASGTAACRGYARTVQNLRSGSSGAAGSSARNGSMSRNGNTSAQRKTAASGGSGGTGTGSADVSGTGSRPLAGSSPDSSASATGADGSRSTGKNAGSDRATSPPPSGPRHRFTRRDPDGRALHRRVWHRCWNRSHDACRWHVASGQSWHARPRP